MCAFNETHQTIFTTSHSYLNSEKICSSGTNCNKWRL